MEQSCCEDTHDDDDVKKLRHQLSGWEMHKLKTLYEYFMDDVIYIIKCLNSHGLLSELKSRTRLDIESLCVMKKDLGVSAFAEKLVKDVLKLRKEDVIGFWESLCIVKKDYLHPNLLGVLNELSERDVILMQQISIDKHGYPMDQEMQDHKQNLLKKTQILKEFKPPQTTLEPRGFSISEYFVDLIVVSTNSFRQRTQHELIEMGVKHENYLQETQRSHERLLIKRIFHWCQQSKRDPKIILISGVPGIGKTTLMQKFICEWVKGKLYQRFSFVFFFRFRDLNRLGKVTLENVILRQYQYLYFQLDNIFKHPERLLFIFDGLDESIHQMDFKLGKTCTNVKEVENLGTIVVSLLKQTLLKGCSVLLTSRPAKISSIDTDNFHRCAEIMGFSSGDRQQYFEQYFENKEKSDKAFKFVKENSPLYTFCYIPSYCWIICTVLSRCFQKKDQELSLLSKTVTQLFVIFLADILENHSVEKLNVREVLKSIGQMAQYGVLNQILVFEEADLRSFNLDLSTNIFSSFLIESNEKMFTFLHHIIQEFLAALVYYLDYTKQELKKTLKRVQSITNIWGDLYLCFLCGLSDETTYSYLKNYLGEFSKGASREVLEWLQDYAHSVKLSNTDVKGKRDCLNRLYCLFESRNKELVWEAIGSNKEFDFSNVQLSPMDCVVLAFILESCETSKKCCLESCFKESEGIERLFSVLHTISELSLSHNLLLEKTMQAIDSELTHSRCRIQNLILLNTGLSDNSCCLLANAINQNCSLLELHLSDNNLNVPRFKDLIDALSSPRCRIQHLALQKTNLQDIHVESLVKLGENRNLKRLNLNYNSFTESGYRFLNQLVQSKNFQEIRICSIEVPREKIISIVDPHPYGKVAV